MLAGDRHQPLTGLLWGDPPQRVVQRWHRVDGANSPRDAQLRERVQVRAVGRCGYRHQLEALCLGEHLESGVGQCIDCDHVTGLQHRQRRDGQSVLRAADDHHLIRRDFEPAPFEVKCHRSPLMGTATVGLVTQQGFQITRGCKTAQCGSQQIGLFRHRWIVEIQIDNILGQRAALDVVARR